MKTTLLISLFISLCVYSNAQPGTLDSTFGNNGKFHYDSAKIDFSTFAIQRDGKFLVGGYNRGRQDPCVMRFNNDGTLDLSFGRRGIVLFEGYLGLQYIGNVIKVAVDKHDKIVICASFFPGSKGFGDIGVIRLNNDGTFDTKFNKTGYASFSLGYYHELTDMIIQSDNKILIGGIVKNGNGNIQFHYITRINSNSKKDTTFGYKGIVRNYLNSIHSLQLLQQPDGKIILSATALYYKIQLERYNANGSIDSSFGTNGTTIKLPSLIDYRELTDIALQNDGKIILTGLFDETLGVIRFNSNGIFDSTFGAGTGHYQYKYDSTGSSIGQSIFINKNDKIVVTGIFNWTIYSCYKRDSCKNGLAIFRFSKNGVLDSTFGINGIGLADFSTEFKSGNTGTPSGKGVIQADGKVVISGQFDNYVFSMARFNMGKKETIASLNNSSFLIAKNEKPSIMLYPNPAKNKLYIKGLNATEESLLTVLDVHGQTVIRVKTNSQALNISQLKNGAYLLRIENKGTVVVKKFLKD